MSEAGVARTSVGAGDAKHAVSLQAAGSGDIRKLLIIFAAVIAAVGVPAYLYMEWHWLDPDFTLGTGQKAGYGASFLVGIGRTIWLLVLSCVFGFLLAIPIGLVQVTGPSWLAAIARGFCTMIRGTPLLIQLWLLYYGLGTTLFPAIPEIRNSFLWPYLREAWPYALLAFTLSFAGYEGEILRGAFAGVPKGELEAARSYGMSPFQVLRRIWLPRAIHQSLPTLSGEVVLQLKSTPLAATVTMMDTFGVGYKVRQELYIVYESLLLVALVYVCLTAVVVVAFRYLENLVPQRRA